MRSLTTPAGTMYGIHVSLVPVRSRARDRRDRLKDRRRQRYAPRQHLYGPESRGVFWFHGRPRRLISEGWYDR